MKKSIVALIIASLLLSACASGPFTETMYVEEPTPTPAPEFAVEKYYTAEEMEHQLQFAEYYDGFAGFQIFMPENWHYEIIESDPESGEFGLDFRPSGSGGGKLSLRCYGGMFGVCGTGLVEAEGELPGTGKLRVGYYDGRDYPSFIGFYDSPGGWALTNDMGEAWKAHEGEIEKILSSLVLDPGCMRVSTAEKLALENSDVYHDYLQTDFDRESGNLRVKFVRMGGQVQQTVAFEKSGEDYIVIKDE